MNKGMQLYLLNRLTELIQQKLYKHYQGKDVESELDGVLDSFDSKLTFRENIGQIKEEIERRGYDLEFLDEEKTLEGRETAFDQLHDNLIKFRNKVFNLQCKLSKLERERNYFQRGYKKLMIIREKLEKELELQSFDYTGDEIVDSLLSEFKREDCFSVYCRKFIKKKPFDKRLNIKDIRYKNQVNIKGITERELMKSTPW